MDPVRLGRVLGTGARLAAKTTVAAVDAALAPNPNATPAPTGSTSAPRASPVPTPVSKPPQNFRHLAGALSSPVRRFSGVLWLELTGVFFGLFALTAATGAWRLRTTWHASPAGAASRTHLAFTLAIAVLFAYFCVSSFVRARRRGRQH